MQEAYSIIWRRAERWRQDPCLEDRHQVRLSVLGIAKNHLRYESLCRAFKDLQSRFQNLLGYPPYYSAVPTGRKFLFEAYTMHGVLFWGNTLSIRTAPAPHTVYYSQGGMEHGTCLVKSAITLTLVPNSQRTPKVGTVLGNGAEE